VTFVAGARLWLLVALAALVAAYVWRQSRGRRHAVRFTNLALLETVAPRHSSWRRHLPATALLLALCTLLLAFARPARTEHVPVQQATVVVAIDVSGSMAATDVAPDRLSAAEAAATSFVKRLPARFQVGLVVFDEAASVLVAPSNDHAAVARAIGQLQLGGGTGIGEAIYAALGSLGSQAKPVRGVTQSARIVLMSDGATNSGRPNELATDAAAAAKVPITTIAYGTDDGQVFVGGRVISVPVDKAALQEIADRTGGKAFEAASAGQLEQVYNTIRSAVSFRVEKHEINNWFFGFGLAFLVVTAAMSLAWAPRLP
jgi:Ca-activated chloride channel family protein